MPKIIEKSISILSDAGLGMAMFSLGKINISSCYFALLQFLLSCNN